MALVYFLLGIVLFILLLGVASVCAFKYNARYGKSVIVERED